MAQVLAISSQVVRGHVGNSAAAYALSRLGHEVWPLPTIILSNHPGHPHCCAQPLSAGVLQNMVDTLNDNGWLGEIDVVVSGYLPSPQHVTLVADTVARIRQTKTISYICDPILGDEPKGLYIDEAAAAAIRDTLIPLADAITPNLFELSWLSGSPNSPDDDPIEMAARLATPIVVATSLRAPDEGQLANLLYTASSTAGNGGKTWQIDVPRLTRAPHGAGDLLTALFCGHSLNGQSAPSAFAKAVAGVAGALEASENSDELRLLPSDAAWLDPEPLPMRHG